MYENPTVGLYLENEVFKGTKNKTAFVLFVPQNDHSL